MPTSLPPFHLFILLMLADDINPSPGPSQCLNVSYANIISINIKYPTISKFISDNDIDLFTMSETWIRPDTTKASLWEITPPSYKLLPQPHEASLGGGLGPTKTCTTFENFLIRISQDKECFHFSSVHKPPSTSILTFFKQFHFWKVIISQLIT